MKRLFFRHFYAVSFLVVFLLAHTSYAGKGTYGGEITLVNDEMIAAQTAGNVVNNPVSEKARDQMAAIMRERCKTAVPKCTVLDGKNKYGITSYRVVYEDNWWFQIETDPSVVEIQTKGATYEELSKLEHRIQRDIFDVGAQIGLRPSGNIGGGHIHIGMHSTLDGDDNLFRNFFVDYANHSELGTGVMSFQGNGNAPTMVELTTDQQNQFVHILKDYDDFESKNYKMLASRIQTEVYYANPLRWTPPEKYQAFNVTRMVDSSVSEDERTFELRAFPGQVDAHEFLLQIRLLDKRLERLRHEKGRLAYHPAPVNLPDDLKAARFYRYVTDSGLSWKDYSHFVAEEYRLTAPQMGCDLALNPGSR